MKNAAGRKNRGFVSGKAAQTSRCRPLVGFLVVVALCAGFAQSGFASVVVYYDDPSSDGSSIMLANMCRNLVGHFDPQIQTVCLDAYQAGDMNAHDFVIYLGNDSLPLPNDFLADVALGAHRVLWIGGNLDQLTDYMGGSGPFGYQADGFTYGQQFDRLDYKGKSLVRDSDPAFFKVQVTGTPTIYSTIFQSVDPKKRFPYFLCGGNLCHLADMPFWTIAEDERYVAFADMLHEFFQTGQTEDHLAMVRFEDLAPGMSNPGIMMQMTDELVSRGVPFSFGVVPIFKDPMGMFNPPGTEYHFSDDPEFVAAINYMLDHGGTMIMHGITHQHDDGISRADWEFSEGLSNVPLPYDSETWVRNRLLMGLAEFASQGWTPQIWETPHYSASHGDYLVFAEFFDSYYDKPLVFPVRHDADPIFGTDLHPEMQVLPFFTPVGSSKMSILPETLGYIDRDIPDQTPAAILARAASLGIVRDGVASFFFHHDLVTMGEFLTVLDGLLASGHRFVGPSEFVDLDEPDDDDDDDDDSGDDDAVDDDDDDDNGSGCGIGG